MELSFWNGEIFNTYHAQLYSFSPRHCFLLIYVLLYSTSVCKRIERAPGGGGLKQ